MTKKKDPLAALLGRRVRDLRKAAGMSQAELAERAHLNVKYVGEVENGHRDVRLTTLSRIGRAFKITPLDLFRFEDEDVTLGEISLMMRDRDPAFRAHLVRLVREMLLLVDAST